MVRWSKWKTQCKTPWAYRVMFRATFRKPNRRRHREVRQAVWKYLAIRQIVHTPFTIGMTIPPPLPPTEFEAMRLRLRYAGIFI